MPKQNRPFVRDGRLQTKKKRTDRSYLGPTGAPAAPTRPQPQPAIEPEDQFEDEAALETVAEVETEVEAPSAPAPRLSPAPEPLAGPATAIAAPAPPTRPAPGRVPTAVRALQQQGVRKRREFDVHALGIRDTQYAIHELRRIAILAAGIVVTLIILGVVLR